MSSIRTLTDGLKDQKASALELLAKGRQTTKTDSLKAQIEAIDPDKATQQEKDRLAGLCRRVEDFRREKPFDRRATAAIPQNPRGSRGRNG